MCICLKKTLRGLRKCWIDIENRIVGIEYFETNKDKGDTIYVVSPFNCYSLDIFY